MPKRLQDLIWRYYETGAEVDFAELLKFCLDQSCNEMAIDLLKLRALERMSNA